MQTDTGNSKKEIRIRIATAVTEPLDIYNVAEKFIYNSSTYSTTLWFFLI